MWGQPPALCDNPAVSRTPERKGRNSSSDFGGIHIPLHQFHPSPKLFKPQPEPTSLPIQSCSLDAAGWKLRLGTPQASKAMASGEPPSDAMFAMFCSSKTIFLSSSIMLYIFGFVGGFQHIPSTTHYIIIRVIYNIYIYMYVYILAFWDYKWHAGSCGPSASYLD